MKQSLDPKAKFNPKDERIYCAEYKKDGTQGHGLLKKYYIPHLDITICDYCEVMENGVKKYLSDFQAQRQCKHLIFELESFGEHIMKFQTLNPDSQINPMIKSLNLNKKFLENSIKDMDGIKMQINDFKDKFVNKLLKYFNFLQDIYVIKDLLDELKFDQNKKLIIQGIGTDQKEAKYIWLSLIFFHMKEEELNPEKFGLTENLIKSVEEFIFFYNDLHKEMHLFVEEICNELLLDVAKLESKTVHSKTKEDLINKLPPLNKNQDNTLINQLRIRISELERELREKSSNNIVSSSKGGENNPIMQKLTAKLEELERKLKEANLINSKLKDERDILSEKARESYKIPDLTSEINNLKRIIQDLERKNLDDKKNSDSKINELNRLLERFKKDKESQDYNEKLLEDGKKKFNLIYQDNQILLGKISEIDQINKKLAQENQKILDDQNKFKYLLDQFEKDKAIQIIQNAELNKKINDLIMVRDNLSDELHNERLKNLKLEMNKPTENNLLKLSNNTPIKQVQFKPEDEIVSNAPPRQYKANSSSNSFDINNFNREIFNNRPNASPRNIKLNIPNKPNDRDYWDKLIDNYNHSTIQDNYPRNIDFNNINPKNLLMNYPNLTKLNSWINAVTRSRKVYRMNLLYKGTVEKFKAKTFKEKCAGKGPTVTVCLTNYGKLIGGYTGLPWKNQANLNEEVRDITKTTFIFSFSDNEIYPMKDNDVAICNAENFGPVFGKYGDLELVDSCNVYFNIHYGIGNSFEYQKSPQAFYGNTKFFVNEYEVYEMTE